MLKITKNPQSCVLVDHEIFNEWNRADIVFLTHWHPVHVNYDVLGFVEVRYV